MTALQTLSDFFAQAQLDACYFTMGRHVAPLSAQHFRDFEEEKIAWEVPFGGHARFAVVLKAPEQSPRDAAVWCLALPLDELGKLDPQARDGLLRRLAEQVGERPSGEALQDPLKDNPLAFKPDDFARAALHAYAARALQLEEKTKADAARRYYTQPTAGDDWQQLDYQSVADMCATKDALLEQRLAAQLALLPAAPATALCRMLEHFPVTQEALLKALEQRATDDPERAGDCWRAIVSSHHPAAAAMVEQLLSNSPTVEQLAIISARGWHWLEHEQRLNLYLMALAQQPDIDVAACVRDIAQLPRLRLLVVMALRNAREESLLKRRLRADMKGEN
ncbi:DUF3549 family protein [Carnimonas nigrificans]|uniref:DUF3549 family protein n=1 Tax=Carnimonas nigrificans TaxID=64323 RepID=UPI000472FB3B|nr:DUF3549 family protein [Carnimonas nigrificans]